MEVIRFAYLKKLTLASSYIYHLLNIVQQSNYNSSSAKKLHSLCSRHNVHKKSSLSNIKFSI